MKIAHLILTHAQPALLQRLVRKLAHEDADIYIHVDAKTDISPFLAVAKGDNIFLVKDRVKVLWGGYSIVQATLNGFEQIIKSGRKYSHINLLSGQDYPIKNIAHIHKFFAAHEGKIFMHSLSVKDEWQEAIPRITDYHLTNYNFPGKYRAQQLINVIMPDRKLPHGIVAVGRSQWFTATPESIAYILHYFKTNPWISRFFKLSWASDELIFQTVLYNSHFRKDMVNDNLLYVDWSKGGPSPKILNMEDADKLTASDKLFARKFNADTDDAILDYLDQITA